MQDAYPQSLPSEPRTSAIIIRLDGEFDRFAERLFMTCVQQLVARDYPAVVFDFGRVGFPDVSAIRCLLQAQRRFGACGKRMTLVGIPPAVERIMALVGLRQSFAMCDEPETAGPSLVQTRVGEQEAT